MRHLKKTIVTFVAISSVSIISVMANQDAATKLNHWYNNAFDKSSATTLQVRDSGLQKIHDTALEQQTLLKEEIGSEIDSFLQNTLTKSKGSIKQHEKNYRHQIEVVQTNLLDGLSYDTTDSQKIQLESEITDDVEELLSEILGE
jgi:hypothetical protein